MERVGGEVEPRTWPSITKVTQQDTPSESSEAESSEASSGEEDEEGWESGQYLLLIT